MIRLLTLIATLPSLIWVIVRFAFGKISSDTARNRLGIATLQKPDQDVIWIHAASLGEISSVRPLLLFLTKTYPGNRLLLTVNNPAALDVVSQWFEIPSIPQAAPLDIPFVVGNFLNHWAPIAFVNVESEVWPNRFAALHRRKIPCAMLNARMSARSTRNYLRIGPAGLGLNAFGHVYAQNPDTATNLEKLGYPANRISVIPNFKSLVDLPASDPKLVAMFDRSKTILAASTHSGEDGFILAAFRRLFEADNSYRLILAPRHPARVDEVRSIAEKMELKCNPMTRTSADTIVSIVDTLGDLPKLYALAKVAIIGGSLIPDIGGHTPYEPVRAGAAIVAGPFHSNFKAEYQELQAGNGCLCTSSEHLFATLQNALKRAQILSENARKVLPPAQDADTLFGNVANTLGLYR